MKNYTNKKMLTVFEAEGIESLVQKIVGTYEEEWFGFSKDEQTNISEIILWEDTFLHLLDGDKNNYTIFSFAMNEFYITKDGRFIISGYIINEDDEWDDSNEAYIDATAAAGQRHIDVASLFNQERIERVA